MLRKKLLNNLKSIELQLRSIELRSLTSDLLPETIEEGSAARESDMHMNALVIRNRLKNLAEQINQTLLRLREGSYGICINCKGKINPQRLEVYPMASTCSSC